MNNDRKNMCGRKVLAWFVLLQKATMKNTMKLADRKVPGMNRIKRVSIIQVWLVTAIVLLFASAPLLGAELKIHVINVSLGDATFIEFPDGTTWLIDQGINGDAVYNYITALGYTSTIDYVVATHFDRDHYGGIDEVLSDITYTTAAYEHVGPKVTGDDSYTQTWDNETTSPMRTSPFPGQTWNFGGVIVECVCVGDTNTYRNNLLDDSYVSLNSAENDYSLGFRISWMSFDYLTLGDLTSNVENVLAPKISDSNFDVLHVSHHGSSTSTNLSFCETLEPEVALISVGSSNSYGHPTQDVINNLNGVGSSWYGADGIYVTEEGTDGIAGTASNVHYLSDNIAITYDSLTNQYTVQGGSRNDTYDADELAFNFPLRFNFQPSVSESSAPPGYLVDNGEAYGTSGAYGWVGGSQPPPTPTQPPSSVQIACTGFEQVQSSDPIGYTIDTANCSPFDSGDYFERMTDAPVRTGSYEFHTRDLDGNAFLEFDSIDVNSYSDVAVSLWFTCADTDYESTDYAKAWVVVDGTPTYFMDLGETQLEAHSTGYVEYTCDVPAGANSIKIWFEAQNNADSERFYLDDVEVTGGGN